MIGCAEMGPKPKKPASSSIATKLAQPQTGGALVTNKVVSPFNKYDSNVVSSIKKQWYYLLDQVDQKTYEKGKVGTVKVRFWLYPDGKVTHFTFLENHTDNFLGYICEAAIIKSAPFPPWPPDMMRTVGKDYREIIFTFYYY